MCSVYVAIVKRLIIAAPELPNSMLPLDMVVEDSRTKLVPVQPSMYQFNK